MTIRVEKRFRQRLRKKAPPLQAAILKCIQRLDENPRHPGLNVHLVLRDHCNHDIIKRSP